MTHAPFLVEPARVPELDGEAALGALRCEVGAQVLEPLERDGRALEAPGELEEDAAEARAQL